jgi:DNA-binding NarL/FixJ family response regulator
MSMRTLIVDDEAAARGRLKRLLADFEGVELIGEAEGGVQAVEMIEKRGEPELALPDTWILGAVGRAQEAPAEERDFVIRLAAGEPSPPGAVHDPAGGGPAVPLLWERGDREYVLCTLSRNRTLASLRPECLH